MSVSAVLNPELQNLAARLGAILGQPTVTADALRMVVQRAPDERLAVVGMLKLAEQSPLALIRALQDAKVAVAGSGLLPRLFGNRRRLSVFEVRLAGGLCRRAQPDGGHLRRIRQA